MRNKILTGIVLALVFTFAANAYASVGEPQMPKGEEGQAQAQQQKKVGQVNAQEHRSAAANFVQSLQDIAGREAGIGEQVRTIAQQQNQSESATVQAIEKVQSRNKIKAFLIGTDYKNLGTLRSEMVQTRNRLEQLNRLMENVQNEGDKTELQNQIKTLEEEQAKIESFIKAQEGKFSLFGWLAKFLSGYKKISSSVSENNVEEQPVASATYKCDGGKTIQAKFYKGEQVPVQPGQPPVPTGRVKLILSDGRSMELNQTLSADGGRYANSDESFVFWSKGDSALVQENGKEVEYKNCEVLPVQK